MKKKFAILSFGVLAFMSLTFIPKPASATQKVCFEFICKLCEPSQGTCCYEGGTNCKVKWCFEEAS